MSLRESVDPKDLFGAKVGEYIKVPRRQGAVEEKVLSVGEGEVVTSFEREGIIYERIYWIVNGKVNCLTRDQYLQGGRA